MTAARRLWNWLRSASTPAVCPAYLRVSYADPVGVYEGTVVEAKVRCARYDFDTVGIALVIRCDDVSWLGRLTSAFVFGLRLRRFAEVLDADARKPETFVGRRARFVYDVALGNPEVPCLAWGLRNPWRSVLAQRVPPEHPDFAELDQSAGILPLLPEKTPSIGPYR